MSNNKIRLAILSVTLPCLLASCASYVPQATVDLPDQTSVTPLENSNTIPTATNDAESDNAMCGSRLPMHFNTKGEKAVVVDPNAHAWGAYDKDGNLIRAGIATSGADWHKDFKGPARTAVGTFRVKSLGDESCVSSKYPKPNGGGPMPYCMFFHGGQALHGSPPGGIVDSNESHGCVRMHVGDAEWLRYNFVKVGTKVVVLPYQ